MDFNRKHAGDLAMSYVPAHCRENASLLYHEFYRESQYDSPASAAGTGGGYVIKTSPATNDKHVHSAHVDAYGNGVTTFDNGHFHDVRAHMVAPYQDPFGVHAHNHPGLLAQPGSEPGSK